MLTVRILSGLPPYGPMAIQFPEGWSPTGREGLVVEFADGDERWTGNFDLGWLPRRNQAWASEDGKYAYVLASGKFWRIDFGQRCGTLLCEEAAELLEVDDPAGWVVATATHCERISVEGTIWRTTRLSLDGFDQLRVAGDTLIGLAWVIDDTWAPFCVDLRSGRVLR